VSLCGKKKLNHEGKKGYHEVAQRNKEEFKD
jgi:hypothetical protein